jgi:hypothetical protein
MLREVGERSSFPFSGTSRLYGDPRGCCALWIEAYAKLERRCCNRRRPRRDRQRHFSNGSVVLLYPTEGLPSVAAKPETKRSANRPSSSAWSGLNSVMVQRLPAR